MASSTTTSNLDLSSVNSLQAGVAVSLLAVGGGIIYSWLLRKGHDDLSTSNAPPVPTTNSNDSKERVVLVLGGGTIGSSFAAVFLSRGLKVHVMDPFATKETVQDRIKMVWPTILARGITKLQEAPIDTALSQSDSLTAAVDAIQKQGQTIDFVQECTWEDVDNKQKILQELDHLVDPSVIIASSTSFIPWTLLVTQCTHKHRILIGHPGK
ncbi:Lambda-crystallin homolog [Seminavis robusta]|uniref:Lambda-crystallin homolog n=1 Tax=Seminavis robusta TaxID=568900 RepID=A0A9N8HAG8_9STRA|nr:Lambda-crystallin homolog [Seminavis robusta]|eukprot:Sro224_g091610.1 Lambda-crystallin homolog (211) ;mRNA; r:32190-32822